MVRVVQYIDSLDPHVGGPVRSVVNLAGALAGVGADVAISVREEGSAMMRGAFEPGSAMVELGGPVLPGRALSPSALRTMRNMLNPGDVLHAHTVWSVSTVQMAALCEAAGAALCLSPCGSLDDWSLAQKAWKKKAFLHTAGRFVLRRTALLLASCDSEAIAIRRLAAPFGVPTRSLLKPLDNDLYRLTEQQWTARRSSPPMVLFLGRLHRGKGIEIGLRTVAMLIRAGVAVKLVVAGSGSRTYRRALEGFADSLGIRSHVEMIGFVSGAEKYELIASAHAVILASEHENYSHVCFESLLAGTPVVTVPGVMTWRELESSGGAIICEAHPAALAHGLRAMLDDDVSTRTGAAAQHKVREMLQPAALATQYLHAYDLARRSLGLRSACGGSTRPGLDAEESCPWP